MAAIRFVALLLLFALSPVWAEAASKLSIKMAATTWEPFMIPDGKTQKGIDYDISRALEKELDMDIAMRRCPFIRCLKEMGSGQLDLQSGVAFNEERAKFMTYLRPAYSEVSAHFYTRKGESHILKQYDDLKKLRVGMVAKSHYFEPFNSDRSLQKFQVPVEEMLFTLLEKKRIDVIIGTSPNLEYQIKKHGHKGKFEMAEYSPDKIIPVYFAISKKSPLLTYVDQFNAVLKKMAANGELARIQGRYK